MKYILFTLVFFSSFPLHSSEKSPLVLYFSGGVVGYRPAQIKESLKIFKSFLSEEFPGAVFKDQHNRYAGLICREFRSYNQKDFPYSPIILTGQSWGASASLALVKCLDDLNQKVDLLLTMDSVHRPGDPELEVIAWNVVRNANFYELEGGIWGGERINKRPDGSSEGITNTYIPSPHPVNPHDQVVLNLFQAGVPQELIREVLSSSK